MGVLDDTYGAALDPQTMAFLSAAASGLQASGPSRMPVSFGQVMGGALQSGVGALQNQQHLNAQNALARAHTGLLEQQIAKAKQDEELTRQMFGGGAGSGGGMGGALSTFNDPDQMEKWAALAVAKGHPGAATLVSQAEKLRTAQQGRQLMAGMQSSPGSLGAGVTPNSPQGQALLANQTGDPGFDNAVMAAQNQALNSNARPGMPARPVQAARPGLFAPLMDSPTVGPSAREMQRQIDTAPPGAANPQQYNQQFDKLLQLHQTAANQAAAREDSGALRRELAGQSDQTRRDIANMNAGLREDNRNNNQTNRTFTQEHQLAQDYSNTNVVKDFRKVLPQFRSAAEYVAGNKFDSSGDRALVFQFAKTLDPQDRVGVNDVKDINKLGNVPERITQAVAGLAEGKMLPDRVRQEMFQVMRSRFGSMNEQQSQIEDEFTQRAKSYMLKPENVVMPFAVRGNKGNANAPGVVDFGQLPKSR